MDSYVLWSGFKKIYQLILRKFTITITRTTETTFKITELKRNSQRNESLFKNGLSAIDLISEAPVI